MLLPLEFFTPSILEHRGHLLGLLPLQHGLDGTLTLVDVEESREEEAEADEHNKEGDDL